jgi:hypothetical protein
MWHVSWVLLLSCAALPALPETDARYAQPSRPTYYPDYAVYHDVDRYNRWAPRVPAQLQAPRPRVMVLMRRCAP